MLWLVHFAVDESNTATSLHYFLQLVSRLQRVSRCHWWVSYSGLVACNGKSIAVGNSFATRESLAMCEPLSRRSHLQRMNRCPCWVACNGRVSCNGWVSIRGGRSHFFRLRLRSCSTFLNPNPESFQIWESHTCSDSGYNRSNRNLPMFLHKKWPRRLLLLLILKSDSGSGSERKTQNPTGTPDPWPPLVSISAESLALVGQLQRVTCFQRVSHLQQVRCLQRVSCLQHVSQSLASGESLAANESFLTGESLAAGEPLAVREWSIATSESLSLMSRLQQMTHLWGVGSLQRVSHLHRVSHLQPVNRLQWASLLQRVSHSQRVGHLQRVSWLQAMSYYHGWLVCNGWEACNERVAITGESLGIGESLSTSGLLAKFYTRRSVRTHQTKKYPTHKTRDCKDFLLDLFRGGERTSKQMLMRRILVEDRFQATSLVLQ